MTTYPPPPPPPPLVPLQVTARLVALLQDAGSARAVSRPDTTSTLTYSIPAVEAALAADDCRCLLRGPREALRKAVAEAGRRHLLYAHRLRVTARDMFVAVRRGEYTRASLMVGGGQISSKRGGGTSVVSGSAAAASSLKALATIGASRATFGVDNRRRASGGSLNSAGGATAAPDERLDAPPPGMSEEASATITAGLGSLQVRLPRPSPLAWALCDDDTCVDLCVCVRVRVCVCLRAY